MGDIDTDAELAWILDLEEQQEIQPDIADRCHGWLDEVDRLRAELDERAKVSADVNLAHADEVERLRAEVERLRNPVQRPRRSTAFPVTALRGDEEWLDADDLTQMGLDRRRRDYD